MSELEKHCQDCRCELNPITLIVAGAPTRYMTGHKVPLLPSDSGNVKGWICPKCNRIVLYGDPK